MKVTIFAKVDTSLNPYLLLFKNALEHQGLEVSVEQEFSLYWVLTRGRSRDAIHFHWLGVAYSTDKSADSDGLLQKLMNSTLAEGLFSGLRLTGFTVAIAIARLQGKAVVYTVHNLEKFGQVKLGSAIMHALAHKVLMSLSSRIHVHNRYSRDLIEASYGRTKGVSVVPHGNYIGYYPNEISKTEARNQLGLSANAFVYLFFGLIRPYKGIEDLIDAFSGLDLPDARLLVVGKVYDNSDYQIELDALSRETAGIKLVPHFIPDEAVQIYMNASDVSVLPYRHITTSGAAALALSFGRPVIAPAITSFPELITVESGILYKPEESGSLNNALRLAKDYPWSEPRILEYAAQFDWRKLGSQLVTLYGKS